jgi:hypothetical protein
MSLNEAEDFAKRSDSGAGNPAAAPIGCLRAGLSYASSLIAEQIPSNSDTPHGLPMCFLKAPASDRPGIRDPQLLAELLVAALLLVPRHALQALFDFFIHRSPKLCALL